MTAFVKEHRYWVSSLTLLVMLASMFLFARSVTESWFFETSRQAGFELSSLSISGISRTSRHDVLAVLDVDNGMPILAVDLKKIQERIEVLPWVREVKVSRIFPGDLQVSIIEREPYALWQMNGKVHLIDSDGMIITGRGLQEFSSLPLIVGEGAPKAIGPLVDDFKTTPVLFEKIKTAVFVSNRRWDVIFKSGIRVKLPEITNENYNSTDAWLRFARLEKEHKFLAREISVIDMRIQGRVTVRVTPVGRRRMDGKEWAT